ncbi:sortase [Patescibacteria group bacterium]
MYSFFLMSIGGVILILVSGSIGAYLLRSQQRFEKKTPFFSPVPSRQLVLGQSASKRGLEENSYQPNYWFSESPALPIIGSKITHYNLSISILGINQAVVEIGGEDLGKSMVHYPGTVHPGQRGNAVIFCHSVLPQFFNPQNYKTICSTLPTLEIGDEITIYYDGILYTYQVFKMFEVQPKDISVLEPDMTGEYLTMITCVPPGTYLRRLIVKSRLI